MTVKEAAESVVCDLYSAVVFRRVSYEHDDTEMGGWMKNRKLVRFIWKSTDDDECPPLEDNIASAEIEDAVAILPFTHDFAFTI